MVDFAEGKSYDKVWDQFFHLPTEYQVYCEANIFGDLELWLLYIIIYSFSPGEHEHLTCEGLFT